MGKNLFRVLSLVLGMMFIFGCASTKNIETRGYVEIRDRVDQKMEEGNAGYIAGTPQPEDRSGLRKTRKVYVLEVSKAADMDEDVVIVEKPESDADQMGTDEDEYESEEEPADFTITPKGPKITNDEFDKDVNLDEPRGASSSTIEYTILKDDTMQKISKKFYDSYSKWPRIYDANKDVIDNPDRIKPGTVIQIPMD